MCRWMPATTRSIGHIRRQIQRMALMHSFYLLGAGVDQRRWLLLGAIGAASAVGLCFCLRA
jgi:hypothetical protein